MTNGDQSDSGFSYVARSAFPALKGPVFVVEHDGKYFVSAAVLEYDPAAAETPEERRGVEQIAELFKDTKMKVPAAKIELGRMEMCQATSPPRQET